MGKNARLDAVLCSFAAILILCAWAGGLAAQTRTDASAPEKRLLRDFLKDQEAIWTSPAHIKHHDLKWFLPFAAVTAGLIATDSHNAGALHSSGDDLSFSHVAANAGFGILAAAAGGSYLVGHIRSDQHAVRSGVLAGEAIADSAVAVSLLKVATNRRRPDTPGADSDFWSGGKSFPSGHTIMSWAAAMVLANRYHDKPLLKFGAYGLASLVSVTRATGRNHYPSDIAVGAVLGYLIGRYVVRHHGAP